MSLRIGITGNIGAGKTTVCQQFERLGVPVYYADQEAKRLMAEEGPLRAAITDTFGKQSYLDTGELNRPYLADRVFGDADALDRLNALVHPAVAEDALAWHARRSTPYTLHEAAIIYEIAAADAYDAVIVVTCPPATRRARVIVRDGRADNFDRWAAEQWEEQRKVAAADYLIVNDGRRLLLPQVLRLDRELRSHLIPRPTVMDAPTE